MGNYLPPQFHLNRAHSTQNCPQEDSGNFNLITTSNKMPMTCSEGFPSPTVLYTQSLSLFPLDSELLFSFSHSLCTSVMFINCLTLCPGTRHYPPPWNDRRVPRTPNRRTRSMFIDLDTATRTPWDTRKYFSRHF